MKRRDIKEGREAKELERNDGGRGDAGTDDPIRPIKTFSFFFSCLFLPSSSLFFLCLSFLLLSFSLLVMVLVHHLPTIALYLLPHSSALVLLPPPLPSLPLVLLLNILIVLWKHRMLIGGRCFVDLCLRMVLSLPLLRLL